MDSIEKVIVYPYDLEFCTVLRHRDFLKGYDVCGLVSPKGWGLCEKDGGYADGGKDLGINTDSDFAQMLDGCNTVFFVQSARELDFDRIVYPKILASAEAGKNIVCTMNLKAESAEEISRKCEANGAYFKYFGLSGTGSLQSNIKIVHEQLNKLQTPVVFVAGVSEKTQKFEIQLSLREKFLKSGYKVSQIGSRHYCELLGFHSFPGFMYGHSMSESAKITMFNHYIKQIEMVEAPDVIIIGIPGGIIPFNHMFTNRYGILAYEVSLAIEPDAAVFSTLYDDYLPVYFEEVSAMVKHRFGFEINCFNISNKQFDWMNSRQNGTMEYTSIDRAIVDDRKNQYSNLKTPVYSALSTEDLDLMYECILNTLTHYGEVEYS